MNSAGNSHFAERRVIVRMPVRHAFDLGGKNSRPRRSHKYPCTANQQNDKQK
jgi:hypothetical protein